MTGILGWTFNKLLLWRMESIPRPRSLDRPPQFQRGDAVLLVISLEIHNLIGHAHLGAVFRFFLHTLR